MNLHKLRTQLDDLWEEVASLSREDPLFEKTRMHLMGRIAIYTKIFVVVRRIQRFILNS